MKNNTIIINNRAINANVAPQAEGAALNEPLINRKKCTYSTKQDYTDCERAEQAMFKRMRGM